MEKFKIEIPAYCLVALVGSTSSGKSSFAKKHFLATEVLSSDFFRAMICDDENEQSISGEAFDLLYHAASNRLKLGKFTVIDATNAEEFARRRVLNLAKEYGAPTAAIVLNLPEELLIERNHLRPDRNIPDSVVHRHWCEVESALNTLEAEGFNTVYVIKTLDEINSVEIVRV